jgi:S-DNA-T family DNA segregation ATPase FtsK/SpoIIIE
VSLGAELKRREALLAEAGAKDLDDYRRVRAARPELTQIARLVLVVDEFKMLADELPDFVEGLVRIAAVGRSLGVHLVLATQRPAGIITGDMRANISLRIALRVRDRSDSDDVIESPVAAAISDRTPGRTWVRNAGGRLVEVQTAYAGALSRPTASAIRSRVRVHSLAWGDLGRPLPVPERSDAGTGSTELAAVVAAARKAAAMLRVTAPTSPWLPPLPESLPHDLLPAGGGEGAVALGLRDDPAAQSQSPFTWHPGAEGNLAIAGGARTGRSTLARTLGVGLAEQWPASNLHLHVIEGTPGSLQGLAALPHVGSVTSTADPTVAARLVARLASSLTADVDGELGRGTPPLGSDTRPLTVLLVDGWEAVEDAFEDVDHGAPTEALLRLARDGLAAGVRLVVTGGRSVVAGRLASVVQHRLVLPMPDPLDLTLAGLSPEEAQGHRRVGRAIDVATGHHVQLAHVGGASTKDVQVRATAQLADRLRKAPDLDPSRLPWRVAPLPRRVAWAELPPSTPHRISIGIGGDDASAVGFDADRHGRRAVIVGGPRSGRTNALATLARQLAAAEQPTAVIATRRTPLSWLSGIRRLHLVPAGDGKRLRELRDAHPDLSVLVDDAEGLDGSPAEPVVLDVLHDLDQTGAWCVAAVEARRAVSLYRGLVPELARHGTGVILSPTSPSDGDLLGVRVDTTRHRLPGRGVLVLDGVATPLQVADPTPPPATEVDTGWSPERHATHTRDVLLGP